RRLEGLLLVEHLRGLGLARQPRLRVVLLRAGQLTGEWAGRSDEHQPEDKDQPLGPTTDDDARRDVAHCAPPNPFDGCLLTLRRRSTGFELIDWFVMWRSSL